ncbi:hypothetical protein HDE_06370 [Halotydeus destructor]|nr:hypothetical protein HDE_06370 [Halotydeus destructor]
MKLANVAVVVILNVLKLCDSFNSDDQNSTFSIEGVSDVELMAKLTLMRDHVIIDPVKEVDEKIMVNLMDHLYLNQLRRHTPGGRLILPALGRRDVGCDTSSKKQDHRISALCNVVTAKCLSAEHVMNIFPPKPVTLAQSLAYTCPLLLFRLDRPLCTHDELLQLRRSERKSS